MTKTLLTTGTSGFVGGHLLRLADHGGFKVLDTGKADIRSPEAIATAVKTAPDAVIHLAAQSFVPQSFADPRETFDINFTGTYNLLARLKQVGFKGAFLFVSSGDVYGPVPEEELPITEERHPQPRNPYAVSKLAAEALCRQWAACEPDWRIMIARPFNHIGAGQSERFVVAGVASQIARIRAGLQEPFLELGDIDVTRDFLDVSDVVSAYFRLLASGISGETYNVCSGREQSVRDIIKRLCRLAGITPEIRQDPARFRPAEQRRVRGCCDKLHGVSGWTPTIPLDGTLSTILDDWTQRTIQ